MQIPPSSSLLNPLNALPVQGVSAAPPAPKGPQTAVAPPPSGAADGRPPAGRAPRGSLVNILA